MVETSDIGMSRS